jgi:hypothetical protein
MTYTDGAGNRASARAASISLDGIALDAMSNDQDSAWCLGEAQYLNTPPHRGTPGQVNPPCTRCLDVVCEEPPARSCEGNAALSYSSVGQCRAEGINEICDYAEQRTECGDGEVCQDGYCAPEGAAPPAIGDVVFNEILYDPAGGLSDARAEWIEVVSVSDTPISLHGCQLGDANGTSDIAGVFLRTGEFGLFARSDDPIENGGLNPDDLFNFFLNNGGDTLTLTCGNSVIDTVIYGRENNFPQHTQGSIQLDPTLQDADQNNAGLSWCAADQAYLANPQHFGTPGAPNTACGGQ